MITTPHLAPRLALLMGVVWLCCIGVAQGQSCSSVLVQAPSGPGNDIEFVLDGTYECGQYANGDWFVVTDGATGGVGITRITPDGVPGRNGWEANPTQLAAHPYDDRIYDHDAALEPALPYLAAPGSAVVKTVSVPDGAGCRPCVQFAAVLSVVEAAPSSPAATFRPSYFGADRQPTRTTADLHLDRLPTLPTSMLPSMPPAFASIAARFAHVQLDHKVNWTGRFIHPVDAMPDYGASIATDNGVGALRFMLDDFDAGDPLHVRALVNYLQMAIDFAGMAQNGVTWPANGGHSNGRKLPLVFAAVLFDDGELAALGGATTFSENLQVAWSPTANNGNGVVLYGDACNDAQYWSEWRFGSGSKTCRDPYGYIDGGEQPGGSYQMCCTAMPWRYTALAVRLLDADAIFAFDELLCYVDRYADVGIWTLPDPCAPFDGDPDNYGITYGPDGAGGCITGAGRFPAEHGTMPGGHYGNGFGNDMWATFRPLPLQCPRAAPNGIAVNRQVLRVSPPAGQRVEDQFAAACITVPWRLCSDVVVDGDLGTVSVDDTAPSGGAESLWLYEHSDATQTMKLHVQGNSIVFEAN